MDWTALHPGLALAPFLILLLFGAHAKADYGQQSAYMAEFKVRPTEASARRLGPDGEFVSPVVVPRNPDWFVTLGAHCLIHAISVAVIAFAYLFVWDLAVSGVSIDATMVVSAASAAALLGWLEFVLHFFIDDCKGQQLFSYRTDQALHYLCKLGWAAVILAIA